MKRLMFTLIAVFAALANPFVGWASPAGANTDANTGVDLRVLIDVSGSMKKNDPNNLRRSALRLLVGVLPEETQAGVWTFGHYVNMQIPLGSVDATWKAQARKKTAEIHSRGLYTNIEEALRTATRDWANPDEGAARHVLLLTDGMVDISKDAAENEASRQRVLAELLPALKAKGAKLHTVALSDRADHELMQGLAETTGGWFEQAEDSDQLQRVFLKMFEQVSQPDTLPLSDNRFTVDNSVRELTLVVFTTQDAAPTRIRMPGGETFGAEAAPNGVKWHGDIGYDLITIDQPQAGDWEILAAVDPDNRAMVVTDLKMETSELPTRLVHGQEMTLQARFNDGGLPLVRPDFLQLISVQAQGVPEADATQIVTMDIPRAADAAQGFMLDWRADLALGRAELITRATGATFSREKRHLFEMVAPVALKRADATAEGLLPITVEANKDVVDVASLKLETKLEDANGASSEPAISGESEGVWRIDMDPAAFAGEAKLIVSVSGVTAEGAAFNYSLPAETFLGQVAVIPTAEAEPAAEVAANESAPVEEVAPPTEEEPMNWTRTLGIFGAVNLFLLLIGGGAFWFLRRRASGDKELTIFEDEAEAATA